MYVYLSAAISADGYLDHRSDERLVLSGPEDLAEIKRLRAGFDAILVGAGTVRRDNPSLVVREPELRAARKKAGMPADITKVTVTASGNIDPSGRFFTEGAGEKIVIATPGTDPARIAALEEVATVVVSPQPAITPEAIVSLLESRGLQSLFVEGGGEVLSAFLDSGGSCHLRLAVAPFFLGAHGAAKIAGRVGVDANRRMALLRAYPVGDMAVAEYLLNGSPDDYRMLELAIGEAGKCPPSDTAYSVGAVVVTADGRRFTGYSRETGGSNHAEEEAVEKAIRAGVSLEGATIYSSMEPCSSRRSKPKSCSRIIIDQRIKKVVFAAKEPAGFVDCVGEEMLRAAGLDVVYIKDLEPKALEPNRHILK